MIISWILFISSLPAFLRKCMFGLCRAWQGVVFCLISVGLHFAQFRLSQEETEVHLYVRACVEKEERLRLPMQFGQWGCSPKKAESGWKKSSKPVLNRPELHKKKKKPQEDTNHKKQKPRATWWLPGTARSNPDMVENASVSAAVLGTAGQPSHVLTLLFGVSSKVFFNVWLRKSCTQ